MSVISIFQAHPALPYLVWDQSTVLSMTDGGFVAQYDLESMSPFLLDDRTNWFSRDMPHVK